MMKYEEIENQLDKNPDLRVCPICIGLYDKNNRFDVYDVDGIYFKGVCSEECSEKAKNQLAVHPDKEIEEEDPVAWCNEKFATTLPEIIQGVFYETSEQWYYFDDEEVSTKDLDRVFVDGYVNYTYEINEGGYITHNSYDPDINGVKFHGEIMSIEDVKF